MALRISAGSTAAHLCVDGLSKRYGHFSPIVVDQVSFTIAQGEFFGLLGPSGSGKTTILNLIAGFEEPTGGSISLAGRDITYERADRRSVGLVFQDYALFPTMSAWENIAFALHLRGRGDEALQKAARELLALVRMEGHETKMPRELSGGQQQRIAIARALAAEPKLLLLDEPLSNLDTRLRTSVRKELQRVLRMAGATVILVTHDRDEAFTLCDRVGVLHKGLLKQVGDPVSLYRDPLDRQLAEFLGEANFLPVDFVEGVADESSSSGDRLVAVRARGFDPGEGRAIWRARPARSSEPPAPGTVMELMVRPERIRIHPSHSTPDLDSGTNSALARVKEIVHVGPEVRLTLALGDIEIESRRYEGVRDAVAAGDSVAISWHAEDGLLFSNAPSASEQ